MFSSRPASLLPEHAWRGGQSDKAEVPPGAPGGVEFRRLVEQTIIALMSAGGDKPSIVLVAAHLSTHVRTLQRRLEPGGRPFRVILDRCRRRLALEELRHGTTAVGEIAATLGYSDPAHFTRAVRRWTGRSPSEVRRYISGEETQGTGSTDS